MGLSTITASRIYKGQTQGNPGEETVLNMETLPYAAFSKVMFLGSSLYLVKNACNPPSMVVVYLQNIKVSLPRPGKKSFVP